MTHSDLFERFKVKERPPDKSGKPSKARWRRDKKLETSWAKIPHHRGLKLAKCIGCPALAILLALEHIIHDTHSNEVKFTNDLLKQYNIARQSKTRGLRQLAVAGVIKVEQKGKAAPVVTHLWYTKSGELRKV